MTDEELKPPIEVKWVVSVTDPEVASRLLLELDNLAAKYVTQLSGLELRIDGTVVRSTKIIL
jgi:hypothetical protein